MDMQTHLMCNVCGTSDCQIMATLTSDIDQECYQACRCRTCGLVFAYPMPQLSDEELQQLYGDDYTENQRSVSLADTHTTEILRTATHRQMEIVERYIPKGKALNVGAMNEAIAILPERGWDLKVVEVSGYAAETARRLWGLDVTVSRIEDFDAPPSSYDFIKLGHVLEHLFDPRKVIEKLATLLRPGGIILIDTDNASGLKTQVEVTSRRLLGEATAGTLVKKLTGKNLHKRYGRLTPPEHVYSFTEKSLIKLLTTSGYEVLETFKPAWGDPTWFPMANMQEFSRLERGFFLIDQVGTRLGAGEVVVVLAQKSGGFMQTDENP